MERVNDCLLDPVHTQRSRAREDDPLFATKRTPPFVDGGHGRPLDIKGSLFCLPPQPRTMLHFAWAAKITALPLRER